MNRKTIIAALVRFARRIGKRLIRLLVRLGAKLLRNFIEGKIVDFREQLTTAREGKARRLKRRITRWSAALKFLTKYEPDADKVATEVDALVASLPMISAAERTDR